MNDEQKAKERLPLPPIPALKICEGTCGRICELAKATEFFDVDQRNPDGLKKRCKQCRAEQRLMKEAAIRNKNLEHVDQNMLRLVANARAGGSKVPHIAEILEKTIQLFGGTNGLAQALGATYLQSEPGSTTRQKILGQILTLAAQTTASGAAKVPLELLTDDEIDAEIARREKNIVNGSVVPDDDDDSDLEDSTDDFDETDVDDEEA